jgi:thioredoxin-related protein
MMMTRFLNKSAARRILQSVAPLALLTALGACGLAAQTPAAADQVMQKAKAEAASQHKDIFLTFRASWCTPCKLLEAFREAPEIRPILDKYFVSADLNIYEENYKKPELNSPGGEVLANKLGGKNNGVPYIVFLDSRGEPIVNSVRIVKGKPGDNVGYPVLPEEIDWFMAMLGKAVPSLPKNDAQTIENWLREKVQLPPH